MKPLALLDENVTRVRLATSTRGITYPNITGL
jgi:hypothetical protein